MIGLGLLGSSVALAVANGISILDLEMIHDFQDSHATMFVQVKKSEARIYEKALISAGFPASITNADESF